MFHGIIHPKPGKVWVNLLLFALTVVSVLFAGSMYSYTGPLPDDALGQVLTLFAHLWVGWPFAVSLLGILLAHEFGHYFVGRARGAAVSLPYFIPFPLPPLGTMGAFIQLKSLPKNKRALFDLAIAGPLAGLVVAIPVLILGLALSPVEATQNTLYTRTANAADRLQHQRPGRADLHLPRRQPAGRQFPALPGVEVPGQGPAPACPAPL